MAETLCKNCQKHVPKKARTLEYCKRALLEACVNGHGNCLKVLVEAGVEVQFVKGPKTPLVCAVRNGNDLCVDVLIRAGADVNFNQEYQTVPYPLMVAAENGHVKVCEQLIEAGAVVNQATWEGYTALILAAQKGLEKVVSVLTKAGADVNLKLGRFGPCTLENASALHLASKHSHAKCVQILLEAGADVMVFRGPGLQNSILRDSSSSYPPGHCFRLLMQAGADVSAYTRTNYGLNSVEKAAKALGIDELDYQNNWASLKGSNIGERMTLKRLCRRAIRLHLMNVNPKSNLFSQVAKSGLPPLLKSYVLYGL